MRFLKPIRWNEGLFLRPHHLQQYDLFLEAREIQRVQTLQSQAYGLVQVALDEDALANFVLGVKHLSAVFPDGTYVDVPENARLPNRSFEEQMAEAGKPLEVQIGVRIREDQVPQTTSEGESGVSATRYLATHHEVYDLDTGTNPSAVEHLVYNLKLFFGEEPTHGYETIPLARLVRTGEKTKPVIHAAGFAPPALYLSASPALRQSARAVVERLAVTLRDLGKRRGGSDPQPLILYQALSGCLPVLKDMVEEGSEHPRRTYQELARLAGALFFRERSGRSAEEIPAYNHRNPGPVFEELRALIFELSEMQIKDAYLRLPMDRSGDQFGVQLPEQAKLAGSRFFLEVAAADSTPQLRVLLMAAKISNPSRLETLRDFALPGVPNEMMAGPPSELPPGQTATYFRLKHEHEEWTTHVLQSGELTAFILNAPQDVKLNLLIVLPE